jgi:hypothetical protein
VFIRQFAFQSEYYMGITIGVRACVLIVCVCVCVCLCAPMCVCVCECMCVCMSVCVVVCVCVVTLPAYGDAQIVSPSVYIILVYHICSFCV